MGRIEGLASSAAVLVLAGGAAAQTVTCLSDAPGGAPGNGACEEFALSADARWVAFVSWSSNLVPGDTNGTADVFVRDRATGTTERVSVATNGAQANGRCGDDGVAITSDGRYVVFASTASNLVPNDTNNRNDLFRRDRDTGQTTRVSLTVSGQQGTGNTDDCVMSSDGRWVASDSDSLEFWPWDTNGEEDVILFDVWNGGSTCLSVDSSFTASNGESLKPAISADGAWVAFTSTGSNLVSGDTNGTWDVFVRNVAAGQTRRVSVSSIGEQANGPSDFWSVSLSSDGLVCAFQSSATNLVLNDTNGVRDVFVHDLWTWETTRVSVDALGVQANGASERAWLSADARFLSFASTASNLVPGDTNAASDVFVRDLGTGTLRRASVGAGGSQANGPSRFNRLSDDGSVLVFGSLASNLVAGDTNGTNDIFATETVPCAGVTSTYCVAAMNSTGVGAHISSLGSLSVSANDFTLTVSGVPPFHAGTFFFGCYQTQIPFGEGYLCITGQQRRLRPLVLADASGDGALQLDFSDPLAPEAVIAPLSQWHFQFWYRDGQPVGHGFNLSDAISVSFCP